jgi:uncharacterized protein YbjT (DUF2867 family)
MEDVMAKKIIAVMGATGAQGGGLVRAILADKSGEFAVRVITRKPEGDKAQALAKLGVEVVAGDLDDVASLTKAFAGPYGAYFTQSRAADIRHVVVPQQVANSARVETGHSQF